MRPISKFFCAGMALSGIAAIGCMGYAVFIGETTREWFDPRLLCSQELGFECWFVCIGFYLFTMLAIYADI